MLQSRLVRPGPRLHKKPCHAMPLFPQLLIWGACKYPTCLLIWSILGLRWNDLFLEFLCRIPKLKAEAAADASHAEPSAQARFSRVCRESGQSFKAFQWGVVGERG